MFVCYLQAWQRVFDFTGRTTRQAFWLFMLLHLLITLALIWLDIVLKGVGQLDVLYDVASIIPMIAIIIRRLHDIGRSGWWGWLFFIPAVGPFVLVYFLSRPGGISIYAEGAAL